MAPNKGQKDGKRRLLGRRTYLKGATVGLLGTSALGAASGVSAASYRTVTVPANGHKSFHVGSGETLKNLLIDITASGARCTIKCSGNDWTLENVGVKGKQSGSTNDGPTLVTVSVPDASSSGTVKHCYFGDGCEYVGNHNSVGMWVDGTGSNAHRGTLHIDEVNLGRFINNGLYGSGTGMISDLGSIYVNNSYFRSNNVDQCRLGKNENSTYQIKDSVLIAKKGEVVHVGPLHNMGVAGRGVWSHDGTGTVLVDNCDVYSDWGAFFVDDGMGLVAKDCRVTGYIDSGVQTQNVTGNPDLTPPSGVPMTPEAAASGSTAASSSGSTTTTTTSTSSLPNTVSISGGGPNNEIAYSLTVSGSLEKSNANGASIDKGDVITGSSATGFVNGGVDSYAYSGDFTDLTINSGGTVTINGQQVDPSTIGGSNTHTISISGGKSDSPTYYRLNVEASLEKSKANGASIDADDEISGNAVWGQLSGGTDSYTYSGAVKSFRANRSVSVVLDSKTVDQSQL